jgi:two-component system CheB/CheR fusion protein
MCEMNLIPFQFRQLMHNLLRNALKFSSPKRPPRILIKSRIVKGNELNNAKLVDAKSYCHISVSDNGIGFEPEYKDRIFEVFQKLHSREEYEGTGIGLAIVKKIVENHNGIVTATSQLDQGTTFDIYIPVTKD